jgi:hypothetical protein
VTSRTSKTRKEGAYGAFFSVMLPLTCFCMTKHAQEAIGVRNIAFNWIEQAVSSPDFVEADPRHPECTRSYKAVAAFDGRILRVVHRHSCVSL